jgi:RHS repeat-associated protein
MLVVEARRSFAPMRPPHDDALNRLTSATPAGGSAASLAYDAVGRLREVVAGAATTRFLYDGAAMIAEYNGSNVLQRRYVHGAGVDEPLVWYEGAGVSDRRWLVQDERGSVVAVTNAAGAATTINTYDEYGVPGAANVGRFQYTGQMWLSEAGLYHYKARAYLPALGRFAQTDPILFAGGMNLYAYVGNDPINATDPSGLQDEIIVVGQRPGGGFGGGTGSPGAYLGNTGGTMSGDPFPRELLQPEDEIIVEAQRLRRPRNSNAYLPRPPGPIIDRRPTPNPNPPEPEGPVFCPVAEVEGSFGVQAGLKLAGIGLHGDAGSIRARASTERSGFVSTQAVAAQALGFTLSYGRESADSNLQVGGEQAAGELFFGIDVGVAAIYGANFRAGWHTNEGGGQCP